MDKVYTIALSGEELERLGFPSHIIDLNGNRIIRRTAEGLRKMGLRVPDDDDVPESPRENQPEAATSQAEARGAMPTETPEAKRARERAEAEKAKREYLAEQEAETDKWLNEMLSLAGQGKETAPDPEQQGNDELVACLDKIFTKAEAGLI